MATLGKKSVIVTTNNTWLVATVEKIIVESPMVKSYFFRMPHPVNHLAGQHYELRLTAENGYQAARLYSAAAASNSDTLLQLSIMSVANGEVSPYIFKQLKVGDEVEIRGPFGKYFVWSPEETQSVLLIGGGSGVVPMHAMLSAHEQSNSNAPMKLLYSARHYDDILFKDDFLSSKDVTITLTQEQLDNWRGNTGRINLEMLNEIIKNLDSPLCYICGMSPFVDAASNGLIELGIPAANIKTERFG